MKNRQQQDAMALGQASRDITRVLQQLERECSRSVRSISIIEHRALFDGACKRTIEIELDPAPIDSWADA